MTDNESLLAISNIMNKKLNARSKSKKGAIIMATKSMSKTIRIDSTQKAKQFLEALDKSKNAPKQESVKYSRNVREITGDEVKHFFNLY